MDITSVSDRGLDQQNPIDKLSDQLVELVNEFLRLQVRHDDLRIGDESPSLYIPREKDFDTVIL